MRRKDWLVVVVLALVAGLLVPSPAYLIAWMIWSGGVHDAARPYGELARLLVIYAGGAVFWGWVAAWYLKPRKAAD